MRCGPLSWLAPGHPDTREETQLSFPTTAGSRSRTGMWHGQGEAGACEVTGGLQEKANTGLSLSIRGVSLCRIHPILRLSRASQDLKQTNKTKKTLHFCIFDFYKKFPIQSHQYLISSWKQHHKIYILPHFWNNSSLIRVAPWSKYSLPLHHCFLLYIENPWENFFMFSASEFCPFILYSVRLDSLSSSGSVLIRITNNFNFIKLMGYFSSLVYQAFQQPLTQ